MDYGLTQAGHEIVLQTESEPAAREVLAARFQGICQPREPSVIERLPQDVDLLVVSVMDAEMEGSWRESWSKDSVASRLKQALRLMKFSPHVAWVLIEAPASLLESDGDDTVPVVCDLVSEFERLGYRWAHRTVAAASFGVPDLKPRVFLVGSRHGDPRALLFAEDAGAPETAGGGGDHRGGDVVGAGGGNVDNGSLNNLHDTPHAFVFNRRPATEGSSMRVFSDVAEGFHPSAGSCALTPDGALAPMEVHDAERMQGLPPGWTLTARPGSVNRVTGPGSGNGLEADADRWRALASSLGCVPAARWIGTKLANPYASPYDASDAKAFEAAVVVPWPSAAFNAGDGRKGVASSPFPVEVNVLPTLGAFISGATAANRANAAAVAKETALECADALRRAGWQPPPPLVAVEVAAQAELAAAGAQAGAGEKRPANAMGAPANPSLVPGGAGAVAPALPAAFGQMGALAGDPGSAAAAQAAALAALAPMMAAAAAAEQANLAAQANLSAEAAAGLAAAARGAGAHEEAPRSKKSKTSHAPEKKKDSPNAHGNAREGGAHKREKKDASSGNPTGANDGDAVDDENADDSNNDSYTVAGITLARRAESQVVWAKLPGHPFWPGLRVDLEPGAKDVVPPETLAMRKEHEALVIFFGENSFGWVREDQVLDFKDFYAEKAREPIRNKARFNAALAEALRDVERRDDGFVPPAVHPRGRAGRHGRDGDHHAHGGAKHHGAEKSGSDKKEESNPKEKEASGELAERGGDGAKSARGGGGAKDEAVPSRLGHSGPGEGGVAVPKKSKSDKDSKDSKNDAAFEAKAAAASALAADATLAAPPESVPAGGDRSARAAMRAVAAAADAAVAAGRFATEGCACRCCKEPSSSSVCLRIEAQRMCGTYPVGAMLALQGAASVGNDIEIYWPLDDTHYVARVTSYDPSELQHMVTYEADGVREFLCLWKEDVKVLDGTEERNKQGVVEAPSAPRAAHAVAGEGAEKKIVNTAGGGGGDAAGDDARGADASADDADAALLMGLQ